MIRLKNTILQEERIKATKSEKFKKVLNSFDEKEDVDITKYQDGYIIEKLYNNSSMKIEYFIPFMDWGT